MKRAATLYTGCILVGSLLVASAARSDDWLQFRKDAQRTGASKDALAFPLTDVWSWSTRGFKDETCLIHTAIWNGRAYFVAHEGQQCYLVCASGRTGVVLWRRQLPPVPATQMRGMPAVTANGKVFVYTQRQAPIHHIRRWRGPQPGVPALRVFDTDGIAVEVYDGLTGNPLTLLSTSAWQLQGLLPELDLLHGASQTVASTGLMLRRPMPEITPLLGTPLISGEELVATSRFGMLFRWTPGNPPAFIRVAHIPVGPLPEIVADSQLEGFPPLAAGGGVFIADDSGYRFGAVVGGNEFHRWHYDLTTTIGIPTADGDAIFAGLGAVAGIRGLVCIESGTGRVRWSFAPTGLPPEPQRIGKARTMHATRWPPRPKPVPAPNSRPAPNPPNGAPVVDANSEDYIAWGWMYKPQSMIRHGHVTSAGVVATGGRVYAEVNGFIVALEQSSGRLTWSQKLPAFTRVTSLVAGPKHLLACYHQTRGSLSNISQLGAKQSSGQIYLAAFGLDNGRIAWERPVTAPGDLSLSDGLVYFSNGDLTVMGPAERTYLIASDTDDPNHYVKPRPPRKEEDPNAPPPAVTGEPPPEPKPAAPLHPAARADASWLRLSLAMPDAELVAKVRARVKLAAAKEVPLSLQLDWLDPTRSAVAGAQGGNWSPAAEERFVKLCAVLAAEAGPQYFDLAPDVNVYLRRYPERTEAVLKLLQRATQAAREGAPGCQVIVSLQVETLLGAYGSGLVSPFGKLAKLERKVEAAQLTRLTELADAVGLNIEPQTGFRNAGVIPRDYLLRVRLLLPGEPLLVTRIKIEADAPGLVARDGQASYLHRTLQCCYWLNARVVMQPELTGYVEGPLDAEPAEGAVPEPASAAAAGAGAATPASPLGGTVPTPGAKPAAGTVQAKNAAPAKPAGPLDPIRLAAAKWRRVVLWERVQRLTAKPPLPDLVGAEETEAPLPVEGQ